MDPNTLTIEQVCKYLQLSQRTIYRMIVRKEVSFMFKIGGQWRCKEEDLKQWLKNKHV